MMTVEGGFGYGKIGVWPLHRCAHNAHGRKLPGDNYLRSLSPTRLLSMRSLFLYV